MMKPTKGRIVLVEFKSTKLGELRGEFPAIVFGVGVGGLDTYVDATVFGPMSPFNELGISPRADATPDYAGPTWRWPPRDQPA